MRVVPSAITASPSLESRATDGSGSASGGQTGSSVTGSSTDTVEGRSPARGVAVLRHELPSGQHDERVVRAFDGQPVRGEHLELRREPVGPFAEHDVQVAARVRGEAARPEAPAGETRGARDGRERAGVEPLDPGPDRPRLGAAQRDLVAQREQLAGLAPHERVGGERVA